MFKLKYLIAIASLAYIVVIGGGALGFRLFVSLPELQSNADRLAQFEIQQAQAALLRQEDNLLKNLAATNFFNTGQVSTSQSRSFIFNGPLTQFESHLETLSNSGKLNTEMVDEFLTLANRPGRSHVSYLDLEGERFQLGFIKSNQGHRFVTQQIDQDWLTKLSAELETQLSIHHLSDSNIQPLKANHIPLLDSQGDVTGFIEIQHKVKPPKVIDAQTAIGILALLSLPIAITALVAFMFVGPMQQLIESIKAMSVKQQAEEIKTHYFIFELGALTRAFNELLFKLSRQQELLKLETLTDQLTGIPNRRAFDQTLEHDWRFALRTKLPITVIIADIDHFKNYNDFYGHQAGDEALAAVALALRSCCRRATEFVARYGGEEFGLILQGEEDPQSFLSSVNQAVRNLQLEHAHSSCADILTISIGACCFHPIDEDENASTEQMEILLKKADEALYKSKESGRNRFTHVVYHH